MERERTQSYQYQRQRPRSFRYGTRTTTGQIDPRTGKVYTENGQKTDLECRNGGLYQQNPISEQPEYKGKISLPPSETKGEEQSLNWVSILLS